MPDLSEYREYLYAAGRRPNTVRAYESSVRRALAWCNRNQVNICEIKPSQLRQLTEEVFKRSHAIRGQLRSALIYYWEMHDMTGPARAIEVPTPPKGRWRGLEDDLVRRLLTHARGVWPQGGVIYVGIYLGIRREEIAGLRWDQFTPDLDWCRIVGKGSKTRELPVHPRLREVLAPHQWGEFVFPGRYPNTHIAPAMLNEWVPALAEAAGVPRITPHQLRHISGGKVVEDTGDIQVGQAWLGHSRVTTTETYSRVSERRLMQALSVLDWEDEEVA